MSYADTKRELLLAVRGPRTQSALSRKLGYRFNQVYRWESGHSKLLWPDFVKLCDACDVDLSVPLKACFGYRSPAERSDLLVNCLVVGASNEFLKDRVGLSRFVVLHWRARRTTPTLEHVLLLLDTVQFALAEFVSRVVDIDKVPSLRRKHQRLLEKKNIASRYPFVEAVLVALGLEKYSTLKKHKDGFVAAALGISLTEEKAVLKALLRVESIALFDKKYVVNEPAFEHYDLRSDPVVSRALKKYWYGRGSTTMETADSRSIDKIFGYYVFGVDRKTKELMRAEYFRFWENIVALWKNSATPEVVQVLNTQLFSLRPME